MADVTPRWPAPSGHPDDELSGYLDGELPTAEMEALSAHLARCAECRRLLQEVDGARTAVRALPRLDPEAVAARPGPPTRTSPGRRRRLGVGMAVAAGVAAVVAGLVLVRGPAPDLIEPGDLTSRHVVRSAVDPGLSLPMGSRPGGGG